MARRSVEEHAALITALLDPVIGALGTASVPLLDAVGRVTAESVRSTHDLPPFRNSQMDGYAARSVDIAAAPVVLPVDAVVPAAAGPAVPLPAGRLVKVMTGAPLPLGSDTVVPVEDVEPASGGVRVIRARAAGEFVREAGSDLAAGSVVVPAGVLLEARHLAAAAAGGAAQVVVRRRLRVAVLTTGSEVVVPGAPLAFGEVHDANGTALAALVRQAGAEVVLAALADDDPAAFAALLARAAAAADLVVTAGGVSKGDFEVVRQVLEPRGAEVVEVAMQPGGPQATAVVDGTPVVCFPGNPVSAQVSFTVFLRAPLRHAAGLPRVMPGTARLAAALQSPAGRRQWLRATVAAGLATPVGGASSHLVAAMARADHLIDVPADLTALPEGAEVTVLPL